MPCDPTAHPSRDPTIWIAARLGTETGCAVLVGVGVALGLAVADGDTVGDTLGLALGVGVVPIPTGPPCVGWLKFRSCKAAKPSPMAATSTSAAIATLGSAAKRP